MDRSGGAAGVCGGAWSVKGVVMGSSWLSSVSGAVVLLSGGGDDWVRGVGVLLKGLEVQRTFLRVFAMIGKDGD